jgi:hypothetical protein
LASNTISMSMQSNPAERQCRSKGRCWNVRSIKKTWRFCEAAGGNYREAISLQRFRTETKQNNNINNKKKKKEHCCLKNSFL